jgi:predicted DNA-binding protein
MRNRTVPVSISMPPKLALRLRVLAAQNNRSRSQLVCELLEKALHPADHPDPHAHPSQEAPGDRP